METPPDNNERAVGLEIEIMQVLDASKWKYGLQIANEIAERRMARGARPNFSYTITKRFRRDKQPRVEDYSPRTSIYVVLTRMVARNFLETRLETPEEQPLPGPPRLLYRLAPGGQRAKLRIPATRSSQDNWGDEPQPA